MLLVGLSVACVLVEHVWSSSLDLRVDDCLPELSCFEGLSAFAFTLVLGVKFFELFAPDLRQSRTLIGAHECPQLILDDSPHEEIRDPQAVEEIPCSVLLLACVLLEIKEVEDICVPRFEIHGERSLPLASSLVHISCSVVVNSQHWHDAVRHSISASDV